MYKGELKESTVPMYTISDYIGKKVRRISFLVKRADDGKYHHLFSIVEYLYPEMQDYEAFRVQKGEYIRIRFSIHFNISYWRGRCNHFFFYEMSKNN